MPAQNSDLQELLAMVGLRVTETQPDGTLDFRLNHGHDPVTGMAYLKGDGVRASFWLDTDVSEDRAERFVQECHPPSGTLQFFDTGNETALRLVVETAAEDRAGLSAAANFAVAARHLWRNGPDGKEDLTRTLAEAGLVRPPLGPDPHAIRCYGAWFWGSRYVPSFNLYMFDVDRVVSELSSGPFFAMSHAGHGLNSYGLNLVTATGRFAAFVQHGYGGVYMSDLERRLEINEAYTYLHELLPSEDSSEFVLSGDRPRWLLAYSDFRGVCGLADLSQTATPVGIEGRLEPHDDLQGLVRRALEIKSQADASPEGGG